MVEDDCTMRRGAGREFAAALIGTWGVYQVVAGLYFVFIRPSLLPEDLRAAATTLDVVRAAAPRVEGWLQLVFTVLGGQMAAVGVLMIGAAMRVRWGERPGLAEMISYVVAGLFSVGLMSAVNFGLHSDFRWPLVAPVLIWLSGMIVLSGPFSRRKTRI